MYKYFLKAFYNKTNKKEYNSQIRCYNTGHKNIIGIKDVIIMAKRSRKNRRSLVKKNINKIVIAEVVKALNAIDHGNKYCCAINNAIMDAAGDLGITGIKKY